jgi:hypothetical protein
VKGLLGERPFVYIDILELIPHFIGRYIALNYKNLNLASLYRTLPSRG